MTRPGPLSVVPRPRSHPARRAPMPAPGEDARGIAVTDRAVLRDGIPWIPVSGELHYSRLPRERWAERARQLRAGGISIASGWSVSVRDTGLAAGDVTLHLLPLAAASTVWVPAAAAARRASATGALLALDAVRVVSRGCWRDVTSA